MKTLTTIAMGLVLGALVFYAIVGIASLHMTTPLVQQQDQCDKLQGNWCMRYEPQTYNPQKTMTAEEL